MSIARIDPFDAKDVGWREAQRARSRLPHSPLRMSSLNSCPPIRLWVCPKCVVTEYSATSFAPICRGGYAERI